MTEAIKSLILSGKSTKEIRKVIDDFPENVTTEYFESLGFENPEAIKLKWKLRKNNQQENERIEVGEARRKLLKSKKYIFSYNANPNFILLDTSSLANGKNIINNAKKVIVINSIMKEMNKVVSKRRKNVKKAICFYRKEIVAKDKYKIIANKKEINSNYCDDSILEFLDGISEDEEKPTLLTADIELAERAKSYGFEYILIVNNNTSNKAKKKEETLEHIASIEEEKIFKEEQPINTENENLIKNEICEEENSDENESFEVLPKNKTFQFYGATFKVKNEEIFIKKFNPHAKVFISATNKITEVTEVTEINTKKIVKISEFDNIVVLARRQKNRDVKGTKIVIVDGEIQCEEEIYTFLNEIYLSRMLPEKLQDEAKKLMIN
jgi:hypothetical protein